MPVTAIPNGTYDVIVVDAEVDSSSALPFIRLDLVITAGPVKGDIVTVRLSSAGSPAIDETEALEALGIPGVLDVVEGEPRVTLDR